MKHTDNDAQTAIEYAANLLEQLEAGGTLPESLRLAKAKLAALESLLPQVATALRLACETFNDDAPGEGVSERQAVRLLSDAHGALRQLYGCDCGYTDPYGWVPEAGCPLHDPDIKGEGVAA